VNTERKTIIMLYIVKYSKEKRNLILIRVKNLKIIFKNVFK